MIVSKQPLHQLVAAQQMPSWWRTWPRIESSIFDSKLYLAIIKSVVPPPTSMQAMRISLAGSPKARRLARRRGGNRRGRRSPGRPRRLRRPAKEAGRSPRALPPRAALAPVLAQRGEPQPRVLAQHPQLAPDIRQMYGAGLVDAEVQLRPDALVLAQRAGEDLDRLVPWAASRSRSAWIIRVG